MAERKAFLVRLDPALHGALQRWADAELRSLNAQIEFLLRRSLRDAGRMPSALKREEAALAAAEESNEPKE